MNDVGLIFDAGYWGTAQQMTLSGPNNTTGPLTIGFTNQTTPQFGACHGRPKAAWPTRSSSAPRARSGR